MAKIIDGKAVSAAVRAGAKQEVEALKAQGIQPGLAVVIVGDDPASRVYVNNKRRLARKSGFIPRSTPCLKRPLRRSFWT